MEQNTEQQTVRRTSYHHNTGDGCTMLTVYVHHTLQDRQAEFIAKGLEHALVKPAREAFEQWSR